MRTVLSFLKPYRLAAIVALLLMLAELTVDLIQPLLMAKIIDEGILRGDLSHVLLWGGWMLAISLFSFAAGILNSFFSAHVSQSYGFDLRRELYSKIQRFSFAQLAQFKTASLITRLTNDVMQLQNTIFIGLRIMSKAPILIIGSIIMAFMVNRQISFMLVITMPILLFFLIWILKKGREQFKRVQDKLDSVNSVMRENLIAMKLIKSFVRHTYEAERFQEVSTLLKERTSTALRLMEMMMPILLFIMNLSILGLLWFGRNEINSGGAQIGEVVAIINYALRIMTSLSVLSFLITVFSRFRASADRVSELLTESASITSGVDYDVTESKLPARGEIEFQHVSFSYPNSAAKVIQDLSFKISGGQMVVLLGATGSGKTSLFQLIPRLYDPDEGRIMIDGRDIKEYTLEQLRHSIGYVPQESLLFTGSIKENIAWGNQTAHFEDIVRAAQHAQIHDTIMGLPKQYETILGQKGVNLSGGQKQRLTIARALVRKPTILLLDDSTSALDLQTEKSLLQAIHGYSCTTFIITQKISTAIDADLILLLEEGRLVKIGNHATLLETSSFYQRIYQSQIEAVNS